MGTITLLGVCENDRDLSTRTGGTNGGCGFFSGKLASEDRFHAPAWERGPDPPASLIPKTTKPGSSAGILPAAAVRLFLCTAL